MVRFSFTLIYGGAVTSFAQSERVALCRTFLTVGPDSPTLCDGWTTRDLAAHLVVRETRPDAALGIAVPALAAHTARVQAGVATTPWTRLVARVRYPPWWTPLSRGPLAEPANRAEFFVHHEDVLRAQPSWDTPRGLAPDHQDALWTDLQRTARMLLRDSSVGVRLTRTGGASIVPRIPGLVGGDPAVEIVGEPGELLLFAFGRDDHAEVTVDGDPADVAAVRAAI